MFWNRSVVVYFSTATKCPLRGASWSIITPPFIMYRNMNFKDVYKIIAGPNLFEFCREVVEKDPDGFIVERLAKYADKFAPESKEVSGIISTATTELAWIANKRIAESLSQSTINFADMTKKKMTVYLILPASRQIAFGRWSRMIVNAVVQANMYEGEKKESLLLMLNEFKTSVGDLEIIEALQTLGAGYGIQILSVFCDLPSIKGLFKDSWETFLGSAGFSAWFAPRLDPTTAKYLSEMTGTIDVPSVSRSSSDATEPMQFGGGVAGIINSAGRALAGNKDNITVGQQTRHYMLPEEIREMGSNEMLVFGSGIKGVIRAGRRPYWEDPAFASKAGPNPYHLSSAKK
jgi:type IV secretion system protein VirD4